MMLQERKPIHCIPFNQIQLIPNLDYKYQFSIHLASTSNNIELLLTSKKAGVNTKKDKRHNLLFLKKHIGRAVKTYILDYLNPNRSQCYFFPFSIFYERSSKYDPYHLHLAVGEVKNKQCFLNKRCRIFLTDTFGIDNPEDLNDDHIMALFEQIFRNMKFRQYKNDCKRDLIMNSDRAFDVRVKDGELIVSYLSKSKFQYPFNEEWCNGFDEMNSVILLKDIKKWQTIYSTCFTI